MAKLVLWPARPLERVFKDSQPARVGEPLRLSCVRNEYEGCMFGLRSDADVKGVRLEVSELRSASGAAVPASWRRDLRLEAMRDGLEDYELLKLLGEEIAEVKRELGGRALELPFERRALELCRRVVPSVTSYARKPEELLAVKEQVVGEILELRRRPLALVLTEPPEWEELEWGPVMVLVRGVCEEGCEVEVNGKRVPVRGGYFATYTGLDQAARVVVKVKKGEAVKVVERRFTVRG